MRIASALRFWLIIKHLILDCKIRFSKINFLAKTLAHFKFLYYLCSPFSSILQTMIYRSVHMIFEPSGQPVPTEEEVQFEAREILERTGWGLPLIEKLRKMADPYWREAVTRCLMDKWNELVRDKDEQTYYYDSDGDIRYCWMDAEYDFGRIIRHCTAEQVDYEQAQPVVQPVYCLTQPAPGITQVNKFYHIDIQQNNGPITTIENSNVNLYSK